MKMELTSEQLQWQSTFKDFVDSEIIPYACQNDKEERICPDVLRKVRKQGFLGSMLPLKYGGMELDNVTLGILNEEVGRGCSSVRSLLTVQGMIALAIFRWGTETQKDDWLPQLASGEAVGAFGMTEPNVGSDAKSIETTAALVEDHYVLNGCKKWITMGQIADVFLILAKCEGKPSAFIVERNREGLEVRPMSGLLGARASMLAELSFENCRIPAANLVGQVGTGLSHVALSSLDYGRYTIACGCVGLAQACLEASIDYANARTQFGRPLRENQLIQKMITEMAVQLKAARLLCYRAGYLKDIGDPDSIMETWAAKYFASIIVNKAASDAVQIHGAHGCHAGYPVERYFRDAKINEIIEGTTQMHEILIATQEFVSARRSLRRKTREGG
ncbi:MAG: acyl-CoA dehydrogenase family protein [Paenibacillus dendritiformis]|uniref:acyl-CoA dehydrogenase family protein n=1 Tax=Paenibacillus dendritiformis TaxID=130049 RepID=UPI00143CD7DD|nr:acyl-CoA dehydrogenase family protein [Paenibacillus dendritiformis]MDU5143008.1 acyl-CoA dehydrogenase family protein [Paenibacillus dendritiformis]NKI19659.1 acyl-CoA dehydrogenase [Paenibacillus dendritiformis]NRF96374.1 acyl-CoA dehydrogenase family protein [Paenibacillus dendritiformis]GIO74024.1 acyl-CoA dehydrogenase [Paenibacillus dendritiformis]